MAARSIWNGTLTFGMVAIPVKLFSATETRGLSFREVRVGDGSRIRHRRLGAESGEEIPYKEIEKGYETESGTVVLTKEEVSAADGTRPKIIEIEHFVDGSEIDPVLYDKAYHLGANTGGAHAYRVLLAALERSGRVGIGRLVLRSRESLVALRPIQGALGLQTMRFADELVEPGDVDLPELKKAPGKKEVAMAGSLVEMLEQDFAADDYTDTYRDAVMQLIEAKANGEDAVISAPPEQEESDDLAKALEASLAALKGNDGSGAAKASGGSEGSGGSKAPGGSKASTSSGGAKASGGSAKASASSRGAKSKAKASSTRAKRSPTAKPGPPTAEEAASRVGSSGAKKTPAKKASAGKAPAKSRAKAKKQEDA